MQHPDSYWKIPHFTHQDSLERSWVLLKVCLRTLSREEAAAWAGQENFWCRGHLISSFMPSQMIGSMFCGCCTAPKDGRSGKSVRNDVTSRRFPDSRSLADGGCR